MDNLNATRATGGGIQSAVEDSTGCQCVNGKLTLMNETDRLQTKHESPWASTISAAVSTASRNPMSARGTLNNAPFDLSYSTIRNRRLAGSSAPASSPEGQCESALSAGLTQSPNSRGGAWFQGDFTFKRGLRIG